VCLSTAYAKLESIQIFNIQGQPRASEGSNSQEYTRLEDQLQNVSFLQKGDAVFFSKWAKPEEAKHKV
jgi:hypothetical protein